MRSARPARGRRARSRVARVHVGEHSRSHAGRLGESIVDWLHLTSSTEPTRPDDWRQPLRFRPARVASVRQRPLVSQRRANHSESGTAVTSLSGCTNRSRGAAAVNLERCSWCGENGGVSPPHGFIVQPDTQAACERENYLSGIMRLRPIRRLVSHDDCRRPW